MRGDNDDDNENDTVKFFPPPAPGKRGLPAMGRGFQVETYLFTDAKPL